MEFKGTKEKWYINRFGNVVAENEEIAYMPSLTKKEHKEANALLISKAPEMLEMLKTIVSEFSIYKSAHGTSKCGAILRTEELIEEVTSI